MEKRGSWRGVWRSVTASRDGWPSLRRLHHQLRRQTGERGVNRGRHVRRRNAGLGVPSCQSLRAESYHMQTVTQFGARKEGSDTSGQGVSQFPCNPRSGLGWWSACDGEGFRVGLQNVQPKVSGLEFRQLKTSQLNRLLSRGEQSDEPELLAQGGFRK